MVQKKIKTIVWSKNAATHYYKILKYFSKEAPDAIDIVGNELLDMIESLLLEYNNPSQDRFKKNNNDTFKAVYSSQLPYLLSN